MHFEITESTFIGTSTVHSLSVMESLIALKIHIHLDNFGTGYPNLALMVTLPFSRIKRDKSILHMEHQQFHRGFIKNMIKAIRAMGRQVIAEGVKTAEQAAFLHRIGYPLAQGYYFSVPMPKRLCGKDASCSP